MPRISVLLFITITLASSPGANGESPPLAANATSVPDTILWQETTQDLTGESFRSGNGDTVVVTASRPGQWILPVRPITVTVVPLEEERGGADLAWLMWLAIASSFLFEFLGAWLFAIYFGFGLLGIWSMGGVDELTRFSLNYWRFNRGKWKKIELYSPGNAPGGKHHVNQKYPH